MTTEPSSNTAADRGHGTAASGSFSYSVNRRTHQTRDPMPSARQLLDSAGFIPAEDCVLIQGVAGGTRSLALDETIDLRGAGTEIFWAFRTDRVFRFTIAGRGFEWGAGAIDEPTLREIGHVGDDDILILERKDEPDRKLGPADEVRLAEVGTEHLRVEARLVEVFFKDKPYYLPPGVYTTEELIVQFPIEQGYLLNLKTPDGELVTLKPGQQTTIKKGMHFYSQVPGGGSS